MTNDFDEQMNVAKRVMKEDKEALQNLEDLNINRFYNLPIVIHTTEHKPDGWTRTVQKTVCIKDILDTWDINDKNDTSEMTQVLRHLKNACEIIDVITQDEAR